MWKVNSRPLVFSNPFRTTGVDQPATHIMIGPLIRNGITSLEKDEKERVAKHIAQMHNAGMIPDDEGVDMSDFTSDVIALPSGVTSLRAAEKDADLARQIERYNAGILNDDQLQQKTLFKLVKKRKQGELRKKIIQYLAESDELDQVPQIFQEEVNEYYRKHQGVKERVEEKRRKKRERAERLAARKRMQAAYWQSGLNDPHRYNPDNKSFGTIPDLRTEDDDDDDSDEEDDYGGSGAFPHHPRHPHYGWRAPRLHRLIQPYKPFVIEQTPEQLIEEQKQDLDDRRNMFRDEMKEQRGEAPPKGMVERAMPKLASPAQFSFTYPKLNFGMTPFDVQHNHLRHKIRLAELQKKVDAWKREVGYGGLKNK